MNTNYKSWKMLFLFCLGLFLGTAFCMKWMEKDLLQDNRLFTVIGLEITYPQEKVYTILSGLDNKTRTILQYHLYFDFVFMAGVFPGIAALCMMARFKTDSTTRKKILLTAAALQLVAWIGDIIEKYATSFLGFKPGENWNVFRISFDCLDQMDTGNIRSNLINSISYKKEAKISFFDLVMRPYFCVKF